MKFKLNPLPRQFAASVMLYMFAARAFANPTGLSVSFGSALAQQTGSQLNITAGNNAVLNWQTFNIAAGEKTIFNQPSPTSIAWNHVSDPNPSQIFGTIQANGVVVLLNSSGFYFGPNSFVSAAGLVVSTANCPPPQNGGGIWEFNGPPPLASIINYGTIKVGNGGSAFLIADKVENHGDIAAPGGTIGLVAGQTVTLSERPDGRGMSMEVTLPAGSVNNYGNLIADAGTIALNAKVVNQNGFIQANSVQNQNGVIELVAADSLNLGANSTIQANGDASSGGSVGGSVTLKSDNSFSDETGSFVGVAGGANGGNGGQIEVSAPKMPSIHTRMDATARNGAKGGKLLLDPDYIILDNSGGDSAGSGTVAVGDNAGSTLDLNVNSAFVGFNQITLQAKYDISLADGTTWSLSDSTGWSSGQLVLAAGRNILFGNPDSSGNVACIFDANSWSIALYAGVSDFSLNKVSPGAGSIFLNAYDPNNSGNGFDPYNPGNGFVQTASGAITMVAGQDITVGAGRVITTGGGSIDAHALSGTIVTGGYAQGYVFKSASSAANGYSVDAAALVGGFSTIAGGDVNLTAGGDVKSLLPINSGYISTILLPLSTGYLFVDNTTSTGQDPNVVTAGSGAYGSASGQKGDVNLVAGGNVTGHFLVANGTGKIFAGVQMDANKNPVKDVNQHYVLSGVGSAGTDVSNPNLALSLIAGGWNVTAAQDIILQEVRNPNGDFNVTRKSRGVVNAAYHYFNYAPSDYVKLTAGNQVQLGASSSLLPRLSVDSLNVPVIYPGILNIVAGAGGVVLNGDPTFNQLILFPSSQGGLTIATTGGGPLYSILPTENGTPQIFNLIVSDSSRHQYTQSSGDYFGLNDHAASPVHLNQETPLTLNISGDMDYILLGAPEAAQINVLGNMNNCRFQGMNLSLADTTSIVLGQAAKLKMEASGILNPATDGALHVGGDINNLGDFTSIDLNQVGGAVAPDLSVLARAQSTSPTASDLTASFYYNATTKVLTYENIHGVDFATVIQLLQNLTVQKVDTHGNLLWLDPEQSIPDTTTVSVFNPATAQALLNNYQSPPSGAYGYALGGGGKFEIQARNMDLGTTAGISLWGAGFYSVGGAYPLASTFNKGADLLVNLTGNLTMYSTSIASLNEGDIYINALGSINTGSSAFSVTALGARGIYSTGLGNVAVYASGDIDVNGSRIGIYDIRPNDGSSINTPSGSVTVISKNGNINAGNGNSGYVVVNGYLVDPVTHAVSSYTPTIPGSGILQTSYTQPGNILVETPNGTINGGAGGIVQLLLNHPVSPDISLFGLPLDLVGLANEFRLSLAGQKTSAQLLERSMNGIVGNSQLNVYAGYAWQKQANALTPAEILAGDALQILPGGVSVVVDKYGNPVINANNMAAGTLVKISDNQNIDSSGSGVIGAGSVDLKASGGITGNIFALGNINLDANKNINVNVLGLGTVSVASASGSVSGTIIGVGGVSASGSSIDANLESNATVSGNTSGDKGLAAGSAAEATATAASAGGDAAQTLKKSTDNGDDELTKKKRKGITLAQKVSRVTVILPAKK